MTSSSLVPFIAIALIASVTGMVHGVGRLDSEFTRLSAAMFAILIMATGVMLNATIGPQNTRDPGADATAKVLRYNAHLAALVYVWGAAAMFAVYSLSDLSWRHAWQYGLGMGIIAIGIMIFMQRLGEKNVPPLMLTILHGLAAIGGLTYLIGAGKLATVKSDWAANEIFLWGGVAIVVLCFLTLFTQLRAGRAPS